MNDSQIKTIQELKKFLELLNRFDLGIIHGDCHPPILIPVNLFSNIP